MPNDKSRACSTCRARPAATRPKRKEIRNANKREKGVVSGEEIWLGLGLSLRVAGLGGAPVVCRSGGRGDRRARRESTPRAWDCLDGIRLHYFLPRLPDQRREAALALGRGLTAPQRRLTHGL